MNTQSNAQSGSSNVKIYMPDTKENYTSFYYKKKGAYGEIINRILETKILKAFPCATIITTSLIREMLEHDKELTKFGYEDHLEEIGGAIGADYILTSSFGNVVDEYHWSLGVSLINVNEKKVSARAELNAGGSADEALYKMIPKIIDLLAEADVCPWKGKISVEAEQKIDSTHSTITNSNTTAGQATTKEVFTKKLEITEKWDIDAVVTKRGNTIGKGSVTYKEKYYTGTETTTTGDVPCFRNTAPCAIIDDIMPGKFSHLLTYSQGKTEGLKNFDNIRIKVTFKPGVDEYYINIMADEPMAVGKGDEQEYEASENSCGKCVGKDIDGPFYGTVWATWIVEGKAKRTDQQISGVLIIKEGIVTKKVSWDLHR